VGRAGRRGLRPDDARPQGSLAPSSAAAVIMHELERALAEITPRAATVTLLLFDEVVERYEREKGFPLDGEERQTILSVLRYIVARECGR